jgi:hypothetical protein
MITSITELVSVLSVPVNLICDKVCSHYHHIFCGGQLANWEDWSRCNECGESNLLDDEGDEDIISGLRHADGAHDFCPTDCEQPWPLPQISRLVTNGIFVGTPSLKKDKVHS